MEVVILPGGKQLAALAADAIEALLRSKPDAVLGLATGSSPLPVYEELARGTGPASTSAGPGPSPWTSTWGSPPAIPGPTAR